MHPVRRGDVPIELAEQSVPGMRPGDLPEYNACHVLHGVFPGVVRYRMEFNRMSDMRNMHGERRDHRVRVQRLTKRNLQVSLYVQWRRL